MIQEPFGQYDMPHCKENKGVIGNGAIQQNNR